MNIVPRPEHPRPRFYRASWENLNGLWEYAFDFSLSGREKKWNERTSLDGTIAVPFCPESTLSGIGFTDFIPAVWLLRRFTVSAEQLADAVLLHFGAVDYETEVFINGRLAGRHVGGYTPFSFDVTALLRARREYRHRIRAGRRSFRRPARPVSSRCRWRPQAVTTPVPPASGRPSGWNLCREHGLPVFTTRPTRATASWISPFSYAGTPTAARFGSARSRAARLPARCC